MPYLDEPQRLLPGVYLQGGCGCLYRALRCELRLTRRKGVLRKHCEALCSQIV
jgi:hypothetical protein